MAKKQFKTESKRLLDLMINSIYTNKEIFLRELISNASDALDKRYYLSLTNKEHTVDANALNITITLNKENRQIILEDTGIGMTQEELEKNLGTIAKSGSAEFKSQLDKAEKDTAIIGQFGVGFYSAFMVAKRILVESHSANEDNAYSWSSSGGDGYVISQIDKPEIGTRITLDLKEDTDTENYSEFLEEMTIKSLIKKYSDYVRYPIQMLVTKHIPDPTDENKTIDSQEMETLNSMVPLWKKQKSKITDEEYNEFYKSKFNDWQDPQKVIHYNIEGNISYTALLYIPSQLPYNFYYSDYEPGLQLYTKNVFIMDKVKDLVPSYYRFVKGLVDSDDLNLNISREILQQDHQVKMMAQSIEKKIHSALQGMLKNEREDYEKFFENFGLNIKSGIVADYGMNKDKLQDLLIFRSSNEGKYTTLQEYVDRMKEDQNDIYYACGKTIDDIQRLPAISKVLSKGYEVLYFLDERDEFVSGTLQTFADKQFKSINKGDLDLDSEDEKKQREETAEANKDMLTAMKDELGDKVANVRISSRLTDEPVCVVADEGVSLEMEKYMAQDPMNQGNMFKATKILELNSDHPVFAKLQSLYQDDVDLFNTYTDVLYDQALLLQGLQLDNVAEYTEKVTKLLLK